MVIVGDQRLARKGKEYIEKKHEDLQPLMLFEEFTLQS